MLLNDILIWVVPILWIFISIFSFLRGFRGSACFIAIAGIASLLEPILFYAGYSLPTDWTTQSTPFQPVHYVAWFAQYVLPVIGVLGLLIGYLLAVSHREKGS